MPAGSDHQEIIGCQHGLVGEDGKQGDPASGIAVAVVGERAGRLVVDDVVVGIGGRGTGMEESGLSACTPAPSLVITAFSSRTCRRHG